jgi:hypothetical protein
MFWCGAPFSGPRSGLESRTGGPDVVPQRGRIGSIRSHASRIHRKSKMLRLLDAQSRFIKFGQTVSLGRGYSVTPRDVHGSRRPMCVPAFPDNVKEVVPVPAIPHVGLALPDVLNQCFGCAITCLGSIELSRSLWMLRAWQILTPIPVESNIRFLVVSIELSKLKHQIILFDPSTSPRSPSTRQLPGIVVAREG